MITLLETPSVIQHKYIKLLLLVSLAVLPGWPAATSAKEKNGFVLDDASVPVKQILSGGPPRDGIPAISDPQFVSPAEAGYLNDEDRVLGVDINDVSKAYPVRILDYHEIVNDQIGTQHFTVTYCPLCGSGMVFATNIKDTHLNFGVSGLLYNSDVLLYDRNTESLWSQIMGQAISGRFKGVKLPQLPVYHTSWRDWRVKYPETLVLSSKNRYKIDYNKRLYAGYSTSRKLYFKVSNKAPATYHPKEQVMGLAVDGQFKAYPFSELEKNGAARFTDEFLGSSFTINWNSDAKTAHITDAQDNIVVTTIAYWFAWFTFHPQTAVFTSTE